MTISAPSLHRASNSSTLFLRSRLRRSPASGPRSCPGACTAWPPQSCWSSATSASAISVFTRICEARVADHVLPAITRQPGFLWFVVRDSCVERLLVCASPRRATLLLDTCSLLQPAQFFVRKRSSEKSEVLVTVSVLEAKSCGAETVPELVTSPHTTLPVDTPPLVAVKVQSRLSQSSGPAEAAPLTVSVAPVSAPAAAKLCRGHVAHRGEVPGVGRVVDGECAARDSCGGAQQAHAGRAGDAQRAA